MQGIDSNKKIMLLFQGLYMDYMGPKRPAVVGYAVGNWPKLGAAGRNTGDRLQNSTETVRELWGSTRRIDERSDEDHATT